MRTKKYTKKEVNYSPAKSPYGDRCTACEFILHVPGTDHMECGIVEGPIRRGMWCKAFSLDPIQDLLDVAPATKSKS